ncbi:hypothetical protein THIBAULT_52 [Mycobacterium phage Thibault]|uniref:Uncharacterized protein n=1 Tax=Mycobacterium phage Thibault TaxID=1052673 RepID=G1FGB7_9CAUD|nr:hypothetical protein CL87_gp052 [Mycobacterium phage Thibault]AEJ94156.1 hypothetical protein THIBAULT_52 [Mycobacterium phage Thibault]
MIEYSPFCSHCGGDRGRREPADLDGYGCLENIYHSEDALGCGCDENCPEDCMADHRGED